MDSSIPNEPDQTAIALCKSCGILPVSGQYPNPLCESCRLKFIRYPIPVWVKGFGIGVLVLVIVGLFGFPKQLMIGIHMKRAEIAMTKKKYLTAKRELQQVLVSAPEMKNAKLDLLTASYYTMDLTTLVRMANSLKDVSFEKDAHFSAAEDLTTEALKFFPSDSLYALEQQNTDSSRAQEFLKSYVVQHPEESYAVCTYINSYSEKESPEWCDSMIDKLLQTEPNNINALIAAVSLAREQHRYDTALTYCQRLLNQNAECSYAMAAQARIFMAKGQIAKGIDLAKKTCALDSSDGYSQATLALGYHLNNQPAERDKLIASKATDSTISSYMEFVKDVVNHKAKFN
jgi:lipopolysaccharide biosynthesis regulator YciM